MAKVAVIVPGAGASERFGGSSNKILQRLAGSQPVVLRTVEAFTSREDVCQVQLVVSEADRELVRQKYGSNLGFLGAKLVTGGATRTDSVRNALATVADEAELICIHDAARPCIAQPWIDRVFAEAAKSGAAILAIRLHGTLKRVTAAGVIDETLSRSGLWEAQTPQVFRTDVLLAAYEGARPATDDAALVEATGHAVTVVAGDPRNIKITTPADLAFASAVLRTLPKPKEKRRIHPFEEPQW